MLFSETVWVLKNFLEILAEELIIIRKEQVPVDAGGSPCLGSVHQVP